MPKFKLNWSPNTGDQLIYETFGISKERIEVFEAAIAEFMNDDSVVEIGEGIAKLSALTETPEELAYANYLLGAKIAEVSTRQEIFSILQKSGIGVKVVSKEEAEAIMLSQLHKGDNTVN